MGPYISNPPQTRGPHRREHACSRAPPPRPEWEHRIGADGKRSAATSVGKPAECFRLLTCGVQVVAAPAARVDTRLQMKSSPGDMPKSTARPPSKLMVFITMAGGLANLSAGSKTIWGSPFASAPRADAKALSDFTSASTLARFPSLLAFIKTSQACWRRAVRSLVPAGAGAGVCIGAGFGAGAAAAGLACWGAGAATSFFGAVTSCFTAAAGSGTGASPGFAPPMSPRSCLHRNSVGSAGCSFSNAFTASDNLSSMLCCDR
mmetsp:Transcript_122419/g.305588  ORF Transcript_122419/g.305588 Transcript_122419/m.305588 type:complete len:262 (-) Transcript_122419:444-1229(-)